MPRIAAAVFASLLALAAPGVAAQSPTETRALLNRIEQLENQIQSLNDEVYRGGRSAPRPAARSSAPQALSGNVAADLEVRLQQMEEQMRAINGRIEEQGFEIRRTREESERILSDMQLRLQELEARTGGVATGGVATGAAGAAAGAGLPPPRPTTPILPPATVPASPGGTLGALSESEMRAAGVANAPAAAPIVMGEQESYDAAYRQLSNRDFAAAEAGFKDFLVRFPASPRAGNAAYWLGETHYVRQDMEQAAIAFAQAYQQFPQSDKAPDSLLKMGMSLGALGRTQEACVTYGELLSRFPQAPQTIRGRAERESQTLRCPGAAPRR
jgi:tol-pal system protein YbgF